MDISVVVRGRGDGATVDEILGLARAADDLRYGELWVGEGPTAGDPGGERTLRFFTPRSEAVAGTRTGAFAFTRR